MNNEKLEQIEQLLQTLIKLIQIKEQSRPLEIIQQRELLKQLNISPNTLKTWGKKGTKKVRTSNRGNSNCLLPTR
ncbi:phage protein [Streptococcus pneumoniae]|nr:phage protein [Streptococcus pneumoniae]VIX39772.1 phage protein [Streptococcus pneumoniae]VIX77908.1 phage protein [Streptococcus pneumoniae]VIY64788.1 phage protein [Streptococcus pneumoniae]VJE33593.1 phage protein [Streptococcus pneumoniae]